MMETQLSAKAADPANMEAEVKTDGKIRMMHQGGNDRVRLR